MKTSILLFSTAIFLFHTEGNFSPSSNEVNVSKTSSVQNTDFTFFRTHRQGKAGITATWGVTSVNGVTSFLVQRTYQDPADPYSSWEDVCTVASDPSRSFKYTDENVLAGFIYYRIVAQMADATSITSEVSGIRIVAH